jgi:hypothetical protein
MSTCAAPIAASVAVGSGRGVCRADFELSPTRRPVMSERPAVRVIPTWPHPWWEDVRAGELIRIADEDRVFRVLSASTQGAELQAVVLARQETRGE